MNGTETRSRENPFSTRYTRPGAMPFVFVAGDSAAEIWKRFEAAGRRGAIVGPHGSGKSTLLALLVEQRRAAGDAVVWHALHDGQRRLPADYANSLNAHSLLIVDGYEQLSWWSRRHVRRSVDRTGAGLLVTSHAAPRGLPTLFTTRPTAELAVELTRQLTAGSDVAPSAAAVRRLFDEERGNLREVFFRLYDLSASHRL
jgi:hypothetical protein